MFLDSESMASQSEATEVEDASVTRSEPVDSAEVAPPAAPADPQSAYAALVAQLDSVPAEELRHRLWDASAELQDKERRLTQMQATIRGLGKRLQNVDNFADLREDIEERLQVMQKAHRDDVEHFQGAAKEARLDMLENRIRLRSVEEELRGRHEADVNQRAAALLDDRTRQVNVENAELSRQRIVLAKAYDATQKQTADVARANAALRQRSEITAATEVELLARSVAQQREIAALKKQIKVAEDSFSKLIDDYDEKLLAQAEDHGRQTRQLTKERDDARNDARRTQAELMKLRAAAAKVVQQRGDLDNFFFDALTTVRAQVIEERRQRLLLGTSSPVAPSEVSTASSTLRLDTQRQRLQLTNGRSTLPSSTFHNASNTQRRSWGTDARGLPVLLDSTNISGKALPPIPLPSSSSGNGRGALVTADTSGGNAGDQRADFNTSHRGASASEEEEEFFYDTRGTSSGLGASTIPDAPTWREIQSVDIKDLCWADKERVIRLLFRRIRHQQQYQSTKRTQAPGRVAAESAAAYSASHGRTGTSMFADDDVFLTQQ